MKKLFALVFLLPLLLLGLTGCETLLEDESHGGSYQQHYYADEPEGC